MTSLLDDLQSTHARAALERVQPRDFLLDLRRYASLERPARFELAATDEQLVVLIVWLPGQFGDAHDHRGSMCFFRVMQGVATQRRFVLNRDRCVELVEEDRFLPGSVVFCDGSDIHALGNDPDSADPLVTLHVYRPPPMMREYEVAAGGGA